MQITRVVCLWYVAQFFSDSSLHQWLHGPIKARIDLLYSARVARLPADPL